MVSRSCDHHWLIQALISGFPLKDKKFHSIFTGVTGRNPGAAKKILDKYVKHAYFAFRDRIDDGNVLVNNDVSNDNFTKLRTKFSLPQTAFFKAIIEAIALDEAARGWLLGSEALSIQLENQINHCP